MAGGEIQLYYQAGHVTRTARYNWKRSAKPLRAIPDFSLEMQNGAGNATILIDAKNRHFSGTSEIVYKLLGYQENLGLSPYLAVGLAPSPDRRPVINGVEYSDRLATVAHLPLRTGGRLLRRLLRLGLTSWANLGGNRQGNDGGGR